MDQQHRLTEIDEESRTAICSVCGPTKIHSKGPKHYRCHLRHLEKQVRDSPRKSLTRQPHRKAVAERLSALKCENPGCGFVAEHVVQLDVNHIIRRADGGTDDVDNLEVICANCHRLKTMLGSRGKPQKVQIKA